MTPLDTEYLTFKYASEFRGIPGPHHDPSDYAINWSVAIGATIWDDEDDEGDSEEVTVGHAEFGIVPDAADIDLFYTLDAVDQEMSHMAEMLTAGRPDFLEALGLEGGDILYLSSLFIDPKFRGAKVGYTILNAILATVGRGTSMVVLRAAPFLAEDGPAEGSLDHRRAKAALRRYWINYGFQDASREYLVLFISSDVNVTTNGPPHGSRNNGARRPPLPATPAAIPSTHDPAEGLRECVGGKDRCFAELTGDPSTG